MTPYSIIIVTWLGDELLGDCLKSLKKVYGGRMPEIVVVDNGNTPLTTKVICDEYSTVKYVAAKENLGFAGGNNLGLKYCTNEYVVLLNNDTELTGDSIAPLVEYLDLHHQCAAAQGTIVLASNPEKQDGTGMWWTPLGILAPEGFLTPTKEGPKEPREVFSIGGAFFITRQSAIKKVGGLFYDHFKSYYEEVNLCHRFYLAGYKCAYVPTIPVLHRHSVTAGKFGWHKIQKQYYRNIFFSTLTCFNWWNRLRFGGTIALFCLAQAAVSLVKGNTVYLKAHSANLVQLFKERELIRETRKEVNGFRVLSDRELLKIAIKHQPWSYYFKLFFGWAKTA